MDTCTFCVFHMQENVRWRPEPDDFCRQSARILRAVWPNQRLHDNARPNHEAFAVGSGSCPQAPSLSRCPTRFSYVFLLSSSYTFTPQRAALPRCCTLQYCMCFLGARRRHMFCFVSSRVPLLGPLCACTMHSISGQREYIDSTAFDVNVNQLL